MAGEDNRAALVVMVGPPGSGKSAWIAGRFPVHDVFSLDVFRRMLTGDVADQSATAEAVRMLNLVVAYRMASGLTTVVDACNTRPEYRAPLIEAARKHGVPVLAVVVNTPLQVCQARNAARVAAPTAAAAYPGANSAPVPAEVVSKLWYEARNNRPRVLTLHLSNQTGWKIPNTVGEVDAVLDIGTDGSAMGWEGCLPPAVLAAPWLAGTLDAPFLPAGRVRS